MDHDLLLDLQHLDDPEPPRFGALRAEEAARRAAQERSRRARVLAGAVLAVVLLAGTGLALRPEASPSGSLQTASPPPEPEETTVPSTTLLPELTPTPPAPLPVPTTVAPAPTTTVPGTVPGGAAPSPSTTRPPAASPGAPSPSIQPTGVSRAPEGTTPAPDGLRFTVALDATQVPAGGSVRAVTRFQNTRSTAVTVSGGGCSREAMWRPKLYAGGKPAGRELDCAMAIQEQVAASSVMEIEVRLNVGAEVAPGTYDAYAVVIVGSPIHSERVQVTVVRP